MLNDCCFIYAVKQTGKSTEEQLNLMRMHIKSCYLSVGKIATFAEEFKFKVIPHRIDNENRTRQIKTKNNYYRVSQPTLAQQDPLILKY